jgi:hypothetical protein
MTEECDVGRGSDEVEKCNTLFDRRQILKREASKMCPHTHSDLSHLSHPPSATLAH